jgi:hypothetical protein
MVSPREGCIVEGILGGPVRIEKNSGDWKSYTHSGDCFEFKRTSGSQG